MSLNEGVLFQRGQNKMHTLLVLINQIILV